MKGPARGNIHRFFILKIPLKACALPFWPRDRKPGLSGEGCTLNFNVQGAFGPVNQEKVRGEDITAALYACSKVNKSKDILNVQSWAGCEALPL